MHKTLLVGCLVLLASLAATAVSANTYYVRKGGNDSHSCTLARTADIDADAKLTISGINGGLSCLTAGDTLIIHVGTYTDLIDQLQVPSGTSNVARTVIQGASGEVVTLRPTVALGSAGNGWWLVANYVTVDNLVLDAVNLTGSTNYMMLGDTGTTSNHDITISHVECKNITRQGSGCITFGNLLHHDFLFDYDSFHDIVGSVPSGNPGAYGLYVAANNVTVSHSQFYNNNQCGLEVNKGNPSGIVIKYNIFHDNKVCGLILNNGGGQTVANNIFYNNGTDPGFCAGGYAGCNGVYAAGGSSGTQIINNTLYGNYNGLYISANTGPTFENNIIRASTFADFVDSSTGGTVMSNNICQTTSGTKCTAGNPLFVDAVNHDFNLAAGSPAIDAGLDLSTTCPSGAVCVFNGLKPDAGALEAPTVGASSGSVPNTSPFKILNISWQNPFSPMQTINCPTVSTGGVSNPVVSCPVTAGTNTQVVTLTNAVSGGQAVTYTFAAEDMLASQLIGALTTKFGNSANRAISAQTAVNQVAGSSPTLTQSRCRFLGIPGTANSAITLLGVGENGNITVPSPSSFRLRCKVTDTIADAPATTFELRANENSAGYVKVADAVNGVCSGTDICMAALPDVSQLASTARILTTDQATFIAGAVVENAQGAFPSVDPTTNSETELEYAVQLAPGLSSKTFLFRLYKAGGVALDAYTVTPQAATGPSRADFVGGIH